MVAPKKKVSKPRSRINSKEAKKHIARVRRAGQWTRAVGWLLLIYTPFWAFLSSLSGYTSLFTTLYIFAAPVAVFLIVSGKRLRYFGKESIKPFLVLNTIILILLSYSWLPIIVLILTFIAIGSYGELIKMKAMPRLDARHRLATGEAVVIVLIILTSFGVLTYTRVNHLASDSVVVSSSVEMSSYTSATDSFKINFPGSPEVDNESIIESGTTLTYTTYYKDTDGGERSYMVAALDYTKLEVSKDDALGQVAGSYMPASKGWSGVVSTDTSFLGLRSIDTHGALTTDGQVYDSYIRCFFKDSKLYVLMTINSTKEQHNNFINSFSFTQ